MTERCLPTIVVLISGRGSNLQAICEAVMYGAIHARIGAVISNQPEAAGLEFARGAGITTEIIDHRTFSSRPDFDAALAATIDRFTPDLVVLAGFMRILGAVFVQRYLGRLINIHPSLLPHYPGLNTHQQALADGVAQHGATVHYVTAEVDTGPIIAQASVAVEPGDTTESLAERVLSREHVLYPTVIEWICRGDVCLDEGRALLRKEPFPTTDFDELMQLLC